MGDKVYYKKEKEKMWRGPAIVIGRDGKNVIVKHGGLLREVLRVHVTKFVEEGGQGEEEEGDTEEISGESKNEDEEDNAVRMRWSTKEGEGEWGNVPTMKRGERYEIKSKDGNVNKVEILRRDGKVSSKKWSDSYNVKNLETGELGWKDMRQYKDIRKIPEGKEVYLGNFEDKRVPEGKLKEIESWKKNGVYELEM